MRFMNANAKATQKTDLLECNLLLESVRFAPANSSSWFLDVEEQVSGGIMSAYFKCNF